MSFNGCSILHNFLFFLGLGVISGFSPSLWDFRWETSCQSNWRSSKVRVSLGHILESLVYFWKPSCNMLWQNPFWSCLLGVLCASCTWIYIFFLQIRKIFCCYTKQGFLICSFHSHLQELIRHISWVVSKHPINIEHWFWIFWLLFFSCLTGMFPKICLLVWLVFILLHKAYN